MANGIPFYGKRLPDGRRAPPGERKTYDVKQLWQRNHEILNLVVLGMSHRDVAKHLGITEATVSNTVNSTLGREKLAELRGARDADTWDAAKDIRVMSRKCLNYLGNAMDDEVYDADGNQVQVPVSIKIGICKHVLNDLSGMKVPTKVDARVLNAHLTLEEIEELRELGRRASEELDGEGASPG